MNKPPVIEAILDKYSIVDYLQSQGHDPVRVYGNRHVYSCPLHGPEKDPSFFVYSNDKYQSYYCFGCKRHGDVINLASEIEKVDLKRVIGRMARGMDIVDKEALDRYADNMKEKSNSKTEYELDDLSIRLSCAFRDYMKEVNFDAEELVFMEKVFSRIDTLIAALDISELRKVYDFMIDEALPKRVAEFVARKEQEAAQRFVKSAYAS